MSSALDPLRRSTFSPSELEERRKTLNASEMKRVMDGDWYSLYQEKIGEVEPEDLSDNFAVTLGIVTETMNLEWLNKQHPELKVQHNDSGAVQRHNTDYNFISATPDGYGVVDGRQCVIDAKHTHPFSGDEYGSAEERVIATYKWQMMTQMLCTSTYTSVISPIYGNQFGNHIVLNYDAVMGDEMIAQAQKFWKHVELEEPPANPDAIFGPVLTSNDMRIVKDKDFQNWNCYGEWIEAIPTFISTEKASKQFDKLKKELKLLVPEDVKELEGGRLAAKRDKRGRITLKYDPTINAN
jgi:hypothetical protein